MSNLYFGSLVLGQSTTKFMWVREAGRFGLQDAPSWIFFPFSLPGGALSATRPPLELPSLLLPIKYCHSSVLVAGQILCYGKPGGHLWLGPTTGNPSAVLQVHCSTAKEIIMSLGGLATGSHQPDVRDKHPSNSKQNPILANTENTRDRFQSCQAFWDRSPTASVAKADWTIYSSRVHLILPQLRRKPR